MIHFGSCQTLDGNAEMFKLAMKKTKVLAISGYTEEVDWLDSVVFDMHFLNCLLEHESITKRSLKKVKKAMYEDGNTHNTTKDLGFRLILND